MDKEVNTMCLSCARLGKNCEGTTNKVYSGCIWKEEKDERGREDGERS